MAATDDDQVGTEARGGVADGGSHRSRLHQTLSACAGSRALRRVMMIEFDVVIERDEEGLYVGSLPRLPGCHTQGRSLHELTQRMREAVELSLEVGGSPTQSLEFVGIQRITVAA